MSDVHRVLLGVLLNSVWQIPLLYGAAWLAARLLRRAGFHLQHGIWMTTLVLSVGLPIVSAGGWFRSAIDRFFLHARVNSTVLASLADAAQGGQAVSLESHSPLGVLSVGNGLLALWMGWMVFRLARLLWSSKRIHDLAKSGLAVDATAGWAELARTAYGRRMGVTLLITEELHTPAALGLRTPTVLVPRLLVEHAREGDLRALLAHELAHVARHDFLHNLLLEMVTIPMSYHPVLRLMRSRLSDSRELICDAMAAERVGGAREYARSLVQITSLLTEPTMRTTPALGLLEGQNLEHRVMVLLNGTPRLTKVRAAALALVSLGIFAPCCIAAGAFTFQPAVIAAADLQPYAGTWHWMFKGKPFITMQLVPAGDHFTGYMTDGFFKNDAAGNMIDAGSEPGRSPIVRSFFSGKALHIVVEDDHDKSMSEWTMTLVGGEKAEFNTADPGAPKGLKSWTAERVPGVGRE